MMVFNKRMLLSKAHPLYFYLPMDKGNGEKPEATMTISVILYTRHVWNEYTGTQGDTKLYPWWDEAELIDSETGEVICKNTKRNNNADGYLINFENVVIKPAGTKYTVHLIGVENHIKNGTMFNAQTRRSGSSSITEYYIYQVELQTDTFEITVDREYSHRGAMTVYAVDAYLKDLSCYVSPSYVYYPIDRGTIDDPHLSVNTDATATLSCSTYYKSQYGAGYSGYTLLEDNAGRSILSWGFVSKTFINPYTNASQTVTVYTTARINQEYTLHFDELIQSYYSDIPSKVVMDHKKLGQAGVTIRTDEDDPHLYSVSKTSYPPVLTYYINEPIMYDIETVLFSEFTKEDTPIDSLYIQYKAVGYVEGYPYPVIDASGEIPRGTVYHKIVYNNDREEAPWYYWFFSTSLKDNNTYYPASVDISQPGGTLYYYTTAVATTTGRFTYYHKESNGDRHNPSIITYTQTVSTELEWLDEFAYKYSTVIDDVSTSEGYVVAELNRYANPLIGYSYKDTSAICSFFTAQTKGELGPPDAWYNNHARLTSTWRFYNKRSDYESARDSYINNESYAWAKEKKFFDLDTTQIKPYPGVYVNGGIVSKEIKETRTVGSTTYDAILGYEYVLTESSSIIDNNEFINSLPELPDIYNEFISP